jgi:FPC/CPF motif-containing protein YcgG
MIPSILLTRQDIEQQHSRVPAWGQAVFWAFQQDLSATDPPFPCTFGAEAFKRDTLRFIFVDDPVDPASLQTLHDALVAYTEIYRRIYVIARAC